jgi:hypothetical protein
VVRRLAAAALGVTLTAAAARAHPIHVTYADVRVAGATATVTLRVYTDDLLRAAGGAAGVDAYVRAHFALADAAGRPVPLAPCGTSTRGEMTHLCLTGAAPRGGARVTNAILVALYADQINVVRAGGRTVLLTRGRRSETIALTPTPS